MGEGRALRFTYVAHGDEAQPCRQLRRRQRVSRTPPGTAGDRSAGWTGKDPGRFDGRLHHFDCCLTLAGFQQDSWTKNC